MADSAGREEKKKTKKRKEKRDTVTSIYSLKRKTHVVLDSPRGFRASFSLLYSFLFFFFFFLASLHAVFIFPSTSSISSASVLRPDCKRDGGGTDALSASASRVATVTRVIFFYLSFYLSLFRDVPPHRYFRLSYNGHEVNRPSYVQPAVVLSPITTFILSLKKQFEAIFQSQTTKYNSNIFQHLSARDGTKFPQLVTQSRTRTHSHNGRTRAFTRRIIRDCHGAPRSRDPPRCDITRRPSRIPVINHQFHRYQIMPVSS